MEFECSGGLMGTPNQMEAIGASFEKRESRFQDPESYEFGLLASRDHS
jgi:hypothetical protein